MREPAVAHGLFRLDRPAAWLLPVSLAYLALPPLLFSVTWLAWPVAVTAVAALTAPLIAAMARRDSLVDTDAVGGFAGGTLPAVGAAALGLMLLSGIGGVGHQDPDWLKHNGILKDLIERPWPVIYEYRGERLSLVYYVAYYLPAAAVGKVAGWTAANLAWFAWSLAGLMLAALWFVVLAGRPGWTAVVVFVVFSGLDAVGSTLVTPFIVAFDPQLVGYWNWAHIEKWAIAWQYSSHATMLFWVPNQALAGWILTALIVATLHRPRGRGYAIFFLSLGALWSPFVVLGLLPYVLLGLWPDGRSFLQRLAGYATLPNLAGGATLAIALLFYAAKLEPIAAFEAGPMPIGFSLSGLRSTSAVAIAVAVIGTFCLLEFGLYAAVLARHRPPPSGSAARGLLLPVTAGWLAVLPWFRVGMENELVMRGSIPALFVLASLVARALHDRGVSRRLRIGLAILLAIGSVTPAIEILRHLRGIAHHGALADYRPIDRVTALSQAGDFAFLAPQYTASARAPFFTLLARRSAPEPGPE